MTTTEEMSEAQRVWEMRFASAADKLRKGGKDENAYADLYQEGVRNDWRPQLRQKYRGR